MLIPGIHPPNDKSEHRTCIDMDFARGKEHKVIL